MYIKVWIVKIFLKINGRKKNRQDTTITRAVKTKEP